MVHDIDSRCLLGKVSPIFHAVYTEKVWFIRSCRWGKIHVASWLLSLPNVIFKGDIGMANCEKQVEQEAAYPIPISLYNCYRTVRHEKRGIAINS